MKRLLVINLFFIGSIFSTCYAQVSGYGSFSYGYNQNPLFNYQNQSDQIKQTYLELNYSKDYDESELRLSYVSGLMLFNQFSARNFYEHNIYGRYFLKFTKEDNDEQKSEDTNAEDENISEGQAKEAQVKINNEQAVEDSSDKYLDIMVKAGARHDKDLFKEFDNTGVNLLLSYKFLPAESICLRLTNDFGLRNYTYLSELSNLTDILTLQVSNKFNGSYSYGLRFSAAYKYYTSTLYDTSKYESERTYTKKPGKGKGGAAVNIPSGKQLLLQPQSNGTAQLALGLFYIKTLEGGSVETDLLYRYNPKTRTRYLAQKNDAGMNEDIYNDFFSYDGPEGRVKFSHPLFLGLQMMAEIALTQKNFEAPALNIDGEKINDHRKDLNSSVDLFISRPINIFGNFSVDIIAGAGYVRNQSNDNYNDFSSYSFSGGIGIGI
jgi:hypothetical protein